MSEQDLLLIEQYYRNELSEAERLAFEQRMAEDSDFREEALLHQRAMTAIRLYGKELMKKKLQDRPLVTPKPKPRIWPWMVTTGAVLAVVFGIFWWSEADEKPPLPPQPVPPPFVDTLHQPPPPLPTVHPPVAELKPDAKKLFADAFKPFKPSQDETVKSADTSKAQGSGMSRLASLNKLKQLAQEEKYSESLATIEQLPKELQSNAAIMFFKANSLLALGRTDEAAPLFEGIASNQQTAYASYAQWYAALCALKKGDLPRAKKWLRAVASGSDASETQRMEAKSLLEKLN